MLLGKGLEVGPGQGSRSLRRGIGTDELQGNLSPQVTKHLRGRWIVAQQHRPQPIGQAGTLASQMQDQADFGSHLAGKQAVGIPGCQAPVVGTQDVGDQPGIARIRAGTALPLTPAIGLNQAGWHHVDTLIVIGPQEINHQIVRRLQTHPAPFRRQA